MIGTMKVHCNKTIGKYLTCGEVISIPNSIALSSNINKNFVICPKCKTKNWVTLCSKCDGTGIQYPNSALEEKCIECNGTGWEAFAMEDVPTGE